MVQGHVFQIEECHQHCTNTDSVGANANEWAESVIFGEIAKKAVPRPSLLSCKRSLS